MPAPLLLPQSATFDWHDGAACTLADPDLFFSPDWESPQARLERETSAKDVCAACPVIQECLAWALTAAERTGIWGGTTEEERRPMLKGIRRPTKPKGRRRRRAEARAAREAAAKRAETAVASKTPGEQIRVRRSDVRGIRIA